MSDLISYLPDVIIYIVLGFIFIKVYRFVSVIKNPSDYKHILPESLIYGFILNSIYNLIYSMIPININIYIGRICMILLTVAAAYLSARIVYSQLFTNILCKLNIHQTPIKDFWVDITQGEYSSYITVIDDKHQSIIRGKIKLIETYNNRPLIQISNYTTTDFNTGEINNQKNNDFETIVIDTSKYSEVYLWHPQPKAEKKSEESQSKHNPIKSILNKIKTKFHHD